jgi:hypothetical protein
VVSGVTGQRDNQLRHAPVVVHYSIFLFFMSSIAKKYVEKIYAAKKCGRFLKAFVNKIVAA